MEALGINMKKEMIICIIIIALIIITNIIAQNYTKNCVEDITKGLYDLEDDILKKQNDNQILQKIYDIDTKWHKFHNTLAFYIEHDELEKVETEISNIKGLEKVNKYDDMLPQIEECIFLLEHIRDKHTLTAINIF